MRYEQSLDEGEMALAARTDGPRGDWQDLTNELAKVACPTLFCWGLQDAFLTPDYPMMLTRMVQRGQLHILDAASHHLQEERPVHYHQIVQSFLDQPEDARRSEEHTSELQSLMRISYAVFCLKTKN